MIKLGGLVSLKPLHEAESDKYTHIGYGKYKEKGKEDDDKAPTFKKDGEKFVPISNHAAAAQDADAKDTKKVNIFNKDKEEPKKDEPNQDTPKDNPFGVDRLVYNKRTKTVGIVRMADDGYGEVKTDADGNVDVDELEPYNPMKYPHQKDAKVAPSTSKEIDSRGLFQPFAQNEPIIREPKSEPKKSSSYSGNSKDMEIDMQHAFEAAYTGKGLRNVFKYKDGSFQVNMASYMNERSFQKILDEFNKTNGTNFVAGKIEKTMRGTRVTISEPKEDAPSSEPSQPKREGDPEVNKATLSKAKKLGITPQKLGKEEYQKKMAQAAVAALTDSNFHSEARKLIAKLEGKPEWAEDPRKGEPDMSSPEWDEWNKNSVYSSEYYDADEDTEELGISASNESGWVGETAVDSIAYTLRQNGFDELADTIQSAIKENKSTRLKDLV